MMPPEQKIALAHDHLFQIGGAEQVLKELSDLYPHAPIYTLIHSRKDLDLLEDQKIITSYLQHIPGGTRFFKWCLPLMPHAWDQLDFSGYDVVLSSSSAFVKGIKTPADTVHITYCHTPTRFLWRDSDAYVESLRIPAPARVYVKYLLNHLRVRDYAAAQNVDYFAANSRFISDSIRQHYGRSSVIIHPPVHVAKCVVSSDIDDYYLMVTRLRPYKRVDLAIEAFNNLKLPLVIIGSGEELHRLKSMAKKNIRFLGEIHDEKKYQYLSHCKAFIHPQEEDFGISAVEAMASGRPVIAYNAGGARETIIAGTTGIFFDEQSWESLAYAILNFDQRAFDSRAIRKHAERFDRQVFRNEIRTFVNDASKRT